MATKPAKKLKPLTPQMPSSPEKIPIAHHVLSNCKFQFKLLAEFSKQFEPKVEKQHQLLVELFHALFAASNTIEAASRTVSLKCWLLGRVCSEVTNKLSLYRIFPLKVDLLCYICYNTDSLPSTDAMLAASLCVKDMGPIIAALVMSTITSADIIEKIFNDTVLDTTNTILHQEIAAACKSPAVVTAPTTIPLKWEQLRSSIRDAFRMYLQTKGVSTKLLSTWSGTSEIILDKYPKLPASFIPAKDTELVSSELVLYGMDDNDDNVAESATSTTPGVTDTNSKRINPPSVSLSQRIMSLFMNSTKTIDDKDGKSVSDDSDDTDSDDDDNNDDDGK